jgi:hypothetical protein
MNIERLFVYLMIGAFIATYVGLIAIGVSLIPEGSER